jgi:hypothetical protein
VFAAAPEQLTVAVPVVSTSEPASTSKEPKAMVLTPIVQLIVAAARSTSQKTKSAARNAAKKFGIRPPLEASITH